MERKRGLSWLINWRVLTLCGSCLFAGFLVGLLIFGSPWHLPPAWGDIPTWITGIATVGLLFGAIVTAIYAIRAFREQSKEVSLLAEENKRQADERRRAQAVRVFTGAPQPPRRESGSDPFLVSVPYVRNASDLPVYDVQLWYSVLPDPDDLGVIMPDEETSGSGGALFGTAESAISNVILTFRDAAGFRWIRMPDGNISQQSRPTARESVAAAREPNLPDHYDQQPDQITGNVVDAIVVYPRSRGVLHMPGEYSRSRDLRVKVNSPPERAVIITSEDGSTQGVYHRSRSIGPDERFTLVWDVWNHRDSRVFARLILSRSKI